VDAPTPAKVFMSYKIAVFAGDGIGPEVMGETIALLEDLAPRFNIEFDFTDGLVGGCAIDAHGIPITDATMELARRSDAVLLGAVGGPQWEGLDYSVRPERALLGLRAELGLYSNLRPAVVYPALVDASSLKAEVVSGIDIMVIRELTGGIYFGKPRGVEKLPDGTERGVNTEVYTTPEIERIARSAFDIARKRGHKVHSIDKANVLESTELWRRVVQGVRDRDYADVELHHMYVDNCAMQLVRNPRQFDVIVTNNLFGDILSDEAAMLTGSIGMLPSASLGGKVGMYEPVHGSAPDIAGQDKANPIATILSAAMMLRYSFDQQAAADAIEKAVEDVLAKGFRTGDIAAKGEAVVGCKQMGAAIRESLRAVKV
jgi:3-isopropylmalate dehydrogenase